MISQLFEFVMIFRPTADDDEIYGEKATRKFEFQIQVNRILQIFDEMIKKIETLLCIQEFVKDKDLMEKYFKESDVVYLTKYCSGRFDAIEDDDENVSRLIQLLLSSDLYLHAEQYCDNVRYFKPPSHSNIFKRN
jgi:hypothetical protein